MASCPHLYFNSLLLACHTEAILDCNQINFNGELSNRSKSIRHQLHATSIYGQPYYLSHFGSVDQIPSDEKFCTQATPNHSSGPVSLRLHCLAAHAHSPHTARRVRCWPSAAAAPSHPLELREAGLRLHGRLLSRDARSRRWPSRACPYQAEPRA